MIVYIYMTYMIDMIYNIYISVVMLYNVINILLHDIIYGKYMQIYYHIILHDMWIIYYGLYDGTTMITMTQCDTPVSYDNPPFPSCEMLTQYLIQYSTSSGFFTWIG